MHYARTHLSTLILVLYAWLTTYKGWPSKWRLPLKSYHWPKSRCGLCHLHSRWKQRSPQKLEDFFFPFSFFFFLSLSLSIYLSVSSIQHRISWRQHLQQRKVNGANPSMMVAWRSLIRLRRWKSDWRTRLGFCWISTQVHPINIYPEDKNLS